jgi:RNA polymerase sigma-70 factor (ECF subfamily)
VLVDVYLKHASPPTAEKAEISAAIEAITRAASPRFPALGVSAETFVRHLARALPNSRDVVAAAPGFHAEDFLLVVAALEGEAAAKDRIIRDYTASIPAQVARINRSRAFADDVIQELSTRLFVPEDDRESKLLGYSGRGSLGAFLRTMATRTAQNMMRGKRETPEQEIAEPEGADTTGRSPERALARASRLHAFTEMLRRAIVDLSAEDREGLRLHYVEGKSIEAVAAAFKISRATAARRLARAREAVLLHARAEHVENAGPITLSSDGTLDVPSQLAVSLSKLFSVEP